VGRATLGRIINVIGEAIDEKGDLSKIYANLNHLISMVYYYDVKIFNDCFNPHQRQSTTCLFIGRLLLLLSKQLSNRSLLPVLR